VCAGPIIRKLFRVLKNIVFSVVLMSLQTLDDIIYRGGGGTVTALTRLHPDIARIGIIELHARVLKLPLLARFSVRVQYSSISPSDQSRLGAENWFFFLYCEATQPTREI